MALIPLIRAASQKNVGSRWSRRHRSSLWHGMLTGRAGMVQICADMIQCDTIRWYITPTLSKHGALRLCRWTDTSGRKLAEDFLGSRSSAPRENPQFFSWKKWVWFKSMCPILSPNWSFLHTQCEDVWRVLNQTEMRELWSVLELDFCTQTGATSHEVCYTLSFQGGTKPSRRHGLVKNYLLVRRFSHWNANVWRISQPRLMTGYIYYIYIIYIYIYILYIYYNIYIYIIYIL
jgi:hypothetical protein